MRSIYRTLGARLPDSLTPSSWRTAWFMALGIVAIGISYGAISQASGFPLWQTALLAAFATGGAAELTFVGVVAAGGSPFLAVVGGLLVNTRHFAFGLSVGEYAPRGLRRLLGAHLVNDETTAYARLGGDRRERWQHFAVMALMLFPAWVGGAVLGQWLGSVVDTQAIGIDAAFPVILFCLVAQDVKNPLMGITAAGGAALAVAATPLVPLGLGAVVGLLVLIPAAGFVAARRRRTGAARPGPVRSASVPTEEVSR